MYIYTPPKDEFWQELKNCKLNSLDLVGSSPTHSCNIGEKNPMYGRRFNLTEEQRKKVSLSQIGRPLSEQHKLSISKTKTGIPRSEEVKRKISQSKKGQKLSEETKRKISLSKTKQQ